MKYLILLLLCSSAHAATIEYPLNGISTSVKVDTATPANSRPLPSAYYNLLGARAELALDATLVAMSAKLPATLGAKVSAASLSVVMATDYTPPLSTGSATAANQVTGNNSLASIDGKTPALVSGRVPVDVQASVLPTGAATAALQNSQLTDLDAINTSVGEINTKTPILVSGRVPVDVGASVLPTGAATETTLSAINTKTPALVGGSVPAVLTTGAAVIGSLVANQSVNTSQINGVTPLMGNGVTGTGSQRVTIASDNTPFGVIASSVINTGTFAQITNLVATAQTFTAPANAVGFKIQAPSTNTENISFSIGATATITAGILMEPGRSEDFDTGSNISVIATSAAAQTVTVIWKVKP